MHTLATLSILGLALAPIAMADHSPQVGVDENGIILNGYDAVAYFTMNKPVKGSKEFMAVHDGAIYLFSSAKNRDAFNENPGDFAPQYGGWCAYGAALGKKFHVDGQAYEIVHGKLYVNLDKGIQKKWAGERDAFIRDADAKWPSIKKTPADEL